MSAKKIIVIGLDGMIPEMLETFIHEGIVPNMKGVIDEGAYSHMFPNVHTSTATNWITLSTGSWSGTHGANCFGTHTPDRNFVDPHSHRIIVDEPMDSSMPNTWSLAEYIWDAAERQGKRCILLNWPAAWPPSSRKSIVVNQAGPHSRTAMFFSQCWYSTRGGEETITCRTRSAGRVPDLPASKLPLLEAGIPIPGNAKNREDDKTYRVLLSASTESGYDKVSIYKSKDEKAVAVLSVGSWSDWVSEELVLVRRHRNPLQGFKWEEVRRTLRGLFKFRLIDIAPDGSFTLYRSPVFISEGWAYPAEIAGEILDAHMARYGDALSERKLKGVKVSEFYQSADPVSYIKENFLEIAEVESRGLAFMAKTLAGRHEWDMLFVQIHAPDTLNHYEIGQVSPGTAGYGTEDVEEVWNMFRREYKTLDNLVGEISSLADDDTLLFVISDHGATAINRQLFAQKFFIDAGLMSYEKKEDGNYYYVQEKSKVFVSDSPMDHYLWYNLKGRQRQGIVEPQDLPELEKQVWDILLSIRDPETGLWPYAAALRKEDLDCLGLYGDRVGDILMFHRPGYMQGEFATAGPVPEREWNDFMKTGFARAAYNFPGCYGAHTGLPGTKYKGFSTNAVFMGKGPGIKRGVKVKRPFWTTDFIPTICWLLGIESPRDCEGRVVSEIIERREGKP